MRLCLNKLFNTVGNSPFDKVDKRNPRANNDLLIVWVSFCLSPSTSDNFIFSLPAKSIIFNFPELITVLIILFFNTQFYVQF